mmetsp:Transcript_22062/g.89477  ORF Transcript_22062/g.89477 Transcript_22062/m.89477 type:complete len:109 (+) Transcript_22062:1634-1960(+)
MSLSSLSSSVSAADADFDPLPEALFRDDGVVRTLAFGFERAVERDPLTLIVVNEHALLRLGFVRRSTSTTNAGMLPLRKSNYANRILPDYTARIPTTAVPKLAKQAID